MSRTITSPTGHLRQATLALACALTLTLGGCAGSGDDLLEGSLGPSLLSDAAPPPGDDHVAAQHWQREFQQNPQDVTAVIDYARQLKASGNGAAALEVLGQASVLHGNDPAFASEYGRLALDNNQLELAQRLLAIADNPARPDWRVISARATAMARTGDYAGALPMFKRAHAVAPNEPTVLNNLAMAHVAAGDVTAAETLLRPAVTSSKATDKIKQNYALVLGLQGRYTEAKAFAADGTGDARVGYEQIDRVRDLVKLPENNLSVPQAEPVALRPTKPAAVTKPSAKQVAQR